jgi:3-hydroxyisobutyrate dehydrogenase-like beta-hydroxyacid dehydrogenase
MNWRCGSGRTRRDPSEYDNSASFVDPRELNAEVELVLSCVADQATVEAVYLGVSGVRETPEAAPGFIDVSTVCPDSPAK